MREGGELKGSGRDEVLGGGREGGAEEEIKHITRSVRVIRLKGVSTIVSPPD